MSRYERLRPGERAVGVEIATKAVLVGSGSVVVDEVPAAHWSGGLPAVRLVLSGFASSSARGDDPPCPPHPGRALDLALRNAEALRDALNLLIEEHRPWRLQDDEPLTPA